jgi:hypothetical protein
VGQKEKEERCRFTHLFLLWRHELGECGGEGVEVQDGVEVLGVVFLGGLPGVLVAAHCHTAHLPRLEALHLLPPPDQAACNTPPQLNTGDAKTKTTWEACLHPAINVCKRIKLFMYFIYHSNSLASKS